MQFLPFSQPNLSLTIGECGGLMVSVVVSELTGREFDTNSGQPLFVSLGKALNLTLPPTTHG